MSSVSAPAPPPGLTTSSFEQLDTLVRVTTVQAWVLLVTLVSVLAATILFAVIYRVPKKVRGDGILLIEHDRLVQVRAPATGRLVRLKVSPGQEIVPDSEIGEIFQDDLRDQILESQARLGVLRREDEALSRFEDQERRTQDTAIATLKLSLERSIRNFQDGLKVAKRIVEGSERLRDRNQLSNIDLLDALEKRYDIQNNMYTGSSRLAELELTRVTSENQRQKAQLQRKLEIIKLETKIGLETEKFKRTSRIVSHARGHVTQVLTAADELVREGAPVLLLSSPKLGPGPDDLGQEYESIVFVPAGEGKKIELDDDVEVSPATVKREEHGFIRGKVVAISELPATRLAMETALQHPDLVENFLKKHAPGVLLRIHVKLREALPGPAPVGTSSSPQNSYVWSSSSGRKQPLKTGTMCQAAIVVDRQPLISLVIPWLKRLIDGESASGR